MWRHVLVAAAVSIAPMALVPAPAAACSGPRCLGPYLIPEGDVRIPSSAAGFEWFADHLGGSPEGTVGVWRVEDGEVAVELAIEAFMDDGSWWIRPAEPFVEGARYHVVAGASESCGGPRDITVTAGATAEIPATLGTLAVSAPRAGTVETPGPETGGLCSGSAAAVIVDVTLVLDRSATPWAPLLLYETRVNGSRWDPVRGISGSHVNYHAPGASYYGRGVDRVYLTCPREEDGGVPFRIEMLARIAATDVVIASEAADVVLSCSDVSFPDAGRTPGDEDAGTEAPFEPGAPRGGGCTCGAPGTAAGTGGTVVVFAIAALLAIRRRTR